MLIICAVATLIPNMYAMATENKGKMTEFPEGYDVSGFDYRYEIGEYGSEELIGFGYNGKDYFYIYDNSDIIIGIKDSQNEQIVKYTYDQYGMVSGTYSYENNEWIINNDQDFIGNKNKMLWLGFYFDEETDCYYVNQSYYDPVENRYLDGIDNDEVLTNVNPYLSTEEGIQLASDIDVMDTAVTEWAEALLANDSYGNPIAYSTNWYTSLSDVELLARCIYCEGGTAYTTEDTAVAWVILNRIHDSDFPSDAIDVITQVSNGAVQFASVRGGSGSTQEARVPDKETDRWQQSTYLACLMLSTTNTTYWKQLVGNPINGQVFFYSYTVAQNAYDAGTSIFTNSGNTLLLNGSQVINKVYVLGYGGVSNFAILFDNYNPVSYSRNIYYDYAD